MVAVRDRGHFSGRHRNLWRALLLGRATHARHRRSDGIGSGAKTGPCPRHGRRPASGLVRPGFWPCHVLVGLAFVQLACFLFQCILTVVLAWLLRLVYFSVRIWL